MTNINDQPIKTIETPFEKNAFFIFAAYLISCGIEGIFTLPLAGNIIQLPEIIFLCFAAFVFINAKKINWATFKFIKLDWAILIYALAVFLSWISTGKKNAFGEILGITYFFSFYLLCNLVFTQHHNKIKENAQNLAFYSATIGSIFALIGWPLLYFYGNESMAWLFPGYPILGDTIRVKGLLRGPIILADFLSTIGLVFLLSRKLDYKKIESKWWPSLIIVGSAIIMTKTKSLLILYFLLVWAFFKLYPNIISSFWKTSIRASALSFLILYLVISHVFFLKKDDPNFESRLKSDYSSWKAFDSPLENIAIVPSVYTSQKYLALIAGTRFLPFGIGGNELINYNREIYKEGLIACTNNLTPHSSYFGAFGELGIFGFCTFIFLLFTIYQTIITGPFSQYGLICCTTLFLYVILQGITTDFMNFRHYWILLIFLAMAKRKQMT